MTTQMVNPAATNASSSSETVPRRFNCPSTHIVLVASSHVSFAVLTCLCTFPSATSNSSRHSTCPCTNALHFRFPFKRFRLLNDPLRSSRQCLRLPLQSCCLRLQRFHPEMQSMPVRLSTLPFRCPRCYSLFLIHFRPILPPFCLVSRFRLTLVIVWVKALALKHTPLPRTGSGRQGPQSLACSVTLMRIVIVQKMSNMC